MGETEIIETRGMEREGGRGREFLVAGTEITWVLVFLFLGGSGITK